MSIVIQIKKYTAFFLWKVAPDYMAEKRIRQMEKGQHITIHGGYDFYPHIEEQCFIFLNKEQLGNKKFLHRIKCDIIKSYYLYGTNANEYFCYKFTNKSNSERCEYLPRKRKDTMLTKQMHGQEEYYLNQIKDKNIFYEMAKPFFGREACRVESSIDYIDFCRFIKKHSRFIVKPTRGGSGKGVEILELRDFDYNTEAVFDYLKEDNSSYIVEELVEQDPRMAEWNESSLNTIRVPSMRTQNGIVIFYPSIRIGRAGSIVDNAGAGGTFAAIDPNTGVVISDGFDKRGHYYKQHPDSQKQYKCSQIPEWGALVEFTKKLHTYMPEQHKYIAFDLALSTKGWVVVEANWGELTMPQVEFGKGLYREFKKLLNA